MAEPIFTNVLQVCVVVRDLDASVRRYADEYGFGPWVIYDLNPERLKDMTIGDEPAPFAMRLALAEIDGFRWELVEPSDDNSIFAEFLRTHGEGMHHVAMGVKDHDEAVTFFRRKGQKIAQSARWGGTTFTFLPTEAELGFCAEIYYRTPDFQYPEPDAVYPPGSTWRPQVKR